MVTEKREGNITQSAASEDASRFLGEGQCALPLDEVVFDAILYLQKGVVVYANDRFLNMFSCNRRELYAERGLQRVLGEAFRRAIEDMVSTIPNNPLEVEAQRRDGTHFPLAVKIRREVWNGNQALMVLCGDITALRRVEKVLQEKVKGYEGLNSVCRLIEERRSPDAFFNVFIHEVAPQSMPHPRATVVEVRYDGRLYRNCDAPMLVGKAATLTVGGIARGSVNIGYNSDLPFREEHECKLVQAFAQRFSWALTRLETEKELEASERSFRTLVEDLGDGHFVYQHTADGVFTYLSAGAEAMLGLPLHEMVGRCWRDVVCLTPASLDLVEKAMRSIMRTASHDTVELQYRHPDGSLRHMSVGAHVRHMEGGQLRVEGIATDTTAMKRTEEALRQARQDAEEASRAKSTFLARMSHEIRTPMNAILGLTQLTLKTSLKGEQRDYLETVRDSAEHLLGIINDILDLSKIEARKLELDKEHFELRRCLGSTCKTMSNLAAKKKLEFTLTVKEDVPAVLFGDVSRLRQVLINCISNAIKFTSAGGIAVTIELAKQEDDGRCRLSFHVVDSGIGIPEEQQKTIFNAFSQGELSLSRTYGGTGLGLSICRELVSMMGGEIGVMSKPGQGATFWFTALFDPGDPHAIVEKAAFEESAEAACDASYSILLVEDNDWNAKLGHLVLKRQGNRVAVAATGMDALFKLRNGSYDLVLMDIEMPGLDGFETTGRIRSGEAGEENKDIPIIGLSAHALNEIRSRALDGGMNDFMTKPVDFSQLAAVISRLLYRGTDGAAHTSGTSCNVEMRVDVERAVVRMGEDRALYDNVLTSFMQALPQRLQMLQSMLMNDDLQTAHRELHNFKGIFATLGAESCVQQTVALSRELRNGAQQSRNEAMNSFFEGVAAFQAWYEERLRTAEHVEKDRRACARYGCQGFFVEDLATRRQGPVQNVGCRGFCAVLEGGPFNSGEKVTLQIRRMDEVVLDAVEAEIVWSYGENFGCRFLFENRYAESSIERFLSEIVGGELLGRRAENT